jgi:small-conductance mechanosensitive channel
VVGAIVALGLLGAEPYLVSLAPGRYQPFVRVAVLAAGGLAGALAIRNGLDTVTRGLDRQATVTIRNLGTWTLYILLAIWLASVSGFNLSGLLLGGAILGVVVAAASQASLGNFFAGLVLMLGQPYKVGGSIRLHGPALGNAEYEGIVLDIGALYTTLATATGEMLKLPNSAVVTSALTLGDAPLQVEIELEVPRGTRLRPIEAALRDLLGPSVRSVVIRPRLLDAGGEGKLTCLVQVRSATAIDPAEVAEALAQVVADTTAVRTPSE